MWMATLVLPQESPALLFSIKLFFTGLLGLEKIQNNVNLII